MICFASVAYGPCVSVISDYVISYFCRDAGTSVVSYKADKYKNCPQELAIFVHLVSKRVNLDLA